MVGLSETQILEQMRKDCKGSIEFNGLNVTWDLTDVLENTLAKLKRDELREFADVNGRIIMYNLGIY